jgi:rhodanese-related sulfurtransferase
MAYDTVTPAGAKALLDGGEGWIYLDVRTVEEFAAGHAPGAFNAPIAFRTALGMELNPGFAAAVRRAFAADAPLVLGCAAGVRSARACEVLAAAGFTRLVNMDGGFSGARDGTGTVREPGWASCGFEVTTETAPEHTWAHLGA